MYHFAQAPANIALIKYMGKSEQDTNLPANTSLSYTLENLLSTVQLEAIPGQKDIWEPLQIPGAPQFTLSAGGQKRFIQHLNRLKEYFNYQGGFLIQSCNNFPQGSGLASSASSFAALTKCAVRILSDLKGKPLPSIEEQAQLSRLGSGSSCRSFFAPWAIWEGTEVKAIDLPYKDLYHQVIVISREEKAVSSSAAHQLVTSSPLYTARPRRAEENLKLLLNAFNAQDWPTMYEICWREFQEMHQLFHTCAEPFSYIQPESQKLLNLLQRLWEEKGDGPLITMDAGPNIHLLYRADQIPLAHKFHAEHLIGSYDVL